MWQVGLFQHKKVLPFQAVVERFQDGFVLMYRLPNSCLAVQTMLDTGSSEDALTAAEVYLEERGYKKLGDNK